jgi:YjbE family integral membrane protein
MTDFLLILSAATTSLGSPADIWAAIVHDFSNITEPEAMVAFGQVLLIDLVLAGDNAIAVGALAAGLPAEQRRKVIMIGIAAALVLRIFFALTVSALMSIIGLVLAGGLLLLWVAWRMWRELHPAGNMGSPEVAGDEQSGIRAGKSFAAAAWAVALADVSMSLDNVLGVAGAARDHPGILIVGLIFAVVLMGIAANIIAKYIERYRWIAYVGLVVIIWVAGKMIYDGILDPQLGVLTLFG